MLTRAGPCGHFRGAPARARFAGSPAATAVAFEVMLEDPSLHRAAVHAPRASRLLAAGDSPVTRTEIWMGGAHSHIGEELSHNSLASAWLIDCAGDMDPSFRSSTGRWLACVFPDLDGPLASSNRVAEVVQLTLDSIASGGDAPDRVYVMCQHGMNRSGLVAGLLLRGLGVEPRETVERIRRARPGALANDHFRLMVLGHA